MELDSSRANGRVHAKITIHGNPDCRDPERGRGRGAASEIIRKHGISRNTYFNWKARYSGAEVSDLRRLKELEAENAKLKKMYTDLALENAAIKDLLQRNR